MNTENRGVLLRTAARGATIAFGIAWGSTAMAQPVDICTAFAAGDGVNCATNTLSLKFGTTATDVLEGDDARIGDVGKNASAVRGSYVGLAAAVIGAEPNAYVDNAGTPTKLGVRAADSTCAATYVGSHACTMRELQFAFNRSLALSVGVSFDLHPYVERGGTDLAVTNLKATCGNYTYGTADIYQRTLWAVVDSNPDAVGGATGPSLRQTYGGACSLITDRTLACCN